MSILVLLTSQSVNTATSSDHGLTTVRVLPYILIDSANDYKLVLLDSWEGCKDADVLLESPSAMAGVHIAEALSMLFFGLDIRNTDVRVDIPYFRTFTMPWTKYIFFLR